MILQRPRSVRSRQRLRQEKKVTVLSSGFEGYEIGEVGAFCTLPRRILNAPLRDLGITAGKVTDAIVG